MLVFPSRCNQLHDEGKEVDFLAQSSFDMVTPVCTRPLGLLIGCNDDTVRKGGLGASRAWCVQDESSVRLQAPSDLAGQLPVPRRGCTGLGGLGTDGAAGAVHWLRALQRLTNQLTWIYLAFPDDILKCLNPTAPAQAGR